MNIHEFLTARLDEDFDVAWGAAPSPWELGAWAGSFAGPREILDKFGEVTARTYYGGTTGHVLRFDPTRVLKSIDAQRAVLAAHRPNGSDSPYHPDACSGCGFGGPCDDWWSEHIDECPTLVALASQYADHPDYQESWKS